EEAGVIPSTFFDDLARARRATRVVVGPVSGWLAAERLPEWTALHEDSVLAPAIAPPASRAARAWSREEALVEFVRGRMTLVGPTDVRSLATTLAVSDADVQAALLALEAQGIVLRGRFTAHADSVEWCDRRLLARVHRYTLNRLRAEIEPVTIADY